MLYLYQDVSLAKLLMRRHRLAETHIMVFNSTVKLRMPSQFAELVRKMQFRSHQNQIDHHRQSSPSTSAQRRTHSQRISQLHRRLQLWVPLNRFISVTGIIVDNGIIADDNHSFLHAIGMLGVLSLLDVRSPQMPLMLS